MDYALAGLGIFGGWIVLVVASDILGVLRMTPKRLGYLQSGVLIVAITALLVCGFLELQERQHAQPCPPGRHSR